MFQEISKTSIEPKPLIGTHEMPRQKCRLYHLLPKEVASGGWSLLEAAGVRRFADHDQLFVYVDLPHGWRIKRESAFSRWFALLDGQGNKRAQIFYQRGLYRAQSYINIGTS